jgi:hypothetical protein
MQTDKPAQSFYATRTMRENVAGIVATYQSTGRIGDIKPRSIIHAKKIARGIAKETRRRAK